MTHKYTKHCIVAVCARFIMNLLYTNSNVTLSWYTKVFWLTCDYTEYRRCIHHICNGVGRGWGVTGQRHLSSQTKMLAATDLVTKHVVCNFMYPSNTVNLYRLVLDFIRGQLFCAGVKLPDLPTNTALQNTLVNQDVMVINTIFHKFRSRFVSIKSLMGSSVIFKFTNMSCSIFFKKTCKNDKQMIPRSVVGCLCGVMSLTVARNWLGKRQSRWTDTFHN